MTTNAIKSADGCNDCAILDPARGQPASAPEFLEQSIQRAERAGASDIQLQMAGPVAQIAFRLDGVITSVSELPEHIAERVIGRIKFLARLRTYQESLPQDGGCAECFGTGYHGRVPLVEWLRVDERLRRKLRAAGPDAVEPQRTQQAAASELLQCGLTDERERSRIFTHEMG